MYKSNLLPPHGGKLKPLIIKDKSKKKEILEEAKSFAKINLSSKEISDIIMLATGSFSPLYGFMLKEDYNMVVDEMHLKDGTLWPIPVTLALEKEEAKKYKEGQKVSLNDAERDEILAVMKIEEMYSYDKEREALSTFKTDNLDHPGVKKLYDQGDIYFGGNVQVISDGGYSEKFQEFAYPEETRRIFSEKGWTTIAAFQTRNPIHRSHEYLTKIALEVYDGLFINPIVGKSPPAECNP
ncbi:MAG: sulfate adenylyltransferase, partial [Actinobacteria bacterium]|nr:sulfate adenylyltransferase [Actinomycetota bacterium]